MLVGDVFNASLKMAALSSAAMVAAYMSWGTRGLREE